MAVRDRVIRVTPESYDRLAREARRRGTEPDALADELLAIRLAPAEFDLEQALADMAEVRERVRGPVDGVELVRQGREELERRGL